MKSLNLTEKANLDQAMSLEHFPEGSLREISQVVRVHIRGGSCRDGANEDTIGMELIEASIDETIGVRKMFNCLERHNGVKAVGIGEGICIPNAKLDT